VVSGLPLHTHVLFCHLPLDTATSDFMETRKYIFFFHPFFSGKEKGSGFAAVANSHLNHVH